MNSNAPIKLRIPRQDLADFSTFRANADGASDWAAHLPVTNTAGVVQQLLQALGQLNRVPLSPEVRYSILEALRSTADVALGNLSRRFLHQPLVMPEEPLQMAELADRLLGLLSTAYTIVAIEALQQKDSIRHINPARLVCEAIQRALSLCCRKVLQTFQLFRPVEFSGWLTIHQLYALAERQGLARLPVADPVAGNSSISSIYLQAVMLGCCKPNQLRQSDLSAVAVALGQWTSLIKLHGPDTGSGLFLVDLDSDQPPFYSSLYRGSTGPQCRYIDTAPMIANLEQLRAEDNKSGKPGVALGAGTRLPSNMLAHLIDSLGKMSMRNFTRSPANTPLRVSIGLSAAHYHTAGSRVFDHLLYGDNYVPVATDRVATNPFLQSRNHQDMWGEANPESDALGDDSLPDGESEIAHQIELDEATAAALIEEGPALSPEQHYPTYDVALSNASPGGYCLEWSTDLPKDVKAGDIVSVQEEQGGNWIIAVIRWISRLENSRTLLGLELLSPHAKAYGAMIHQKTGEKSAPIRVLLLPEIELVGQPHTLITPRAGFREQQKITLVRNEETFHIQLSRQVAATASFIQFDFRYIQELGDMLSQDKSGPLDSAYGSLWSKI